MSQSNRALTFETQYIPNGALTSELLEGFSFFDLCNTEVFEQVMRRAKAVAKRSSRPALKRSAPRSTRTGGGVR